MYISVCPYCHSQWINSPGKREFSLYCAALAEFKSLGSSVLPEVVKAREKKQLSSQWRDALPVELWNPHKQAG